MSNLDPIKDLIVLTLLKGFGKLNYIHGYGRDVNKRFVMSRVAINSSDIIIHLAMKGATFEVDELMAESPETRGYIIVNNDKSQECRIEWPEIRPLRELDTKEDEMCVVVFFTDGMKYHTFKRNEFT